jgi:hypothetical protein
MAGRDTLSTGIKLLLNQAYVVLFLVPGHSQDLLIVNECLKLYFWPPRLPASEKEKKGKKPGNATYVY